MWQNWNQRNGKAAMPPSRARGPEPRTRTFDETFEDLHLTPAERTALVWRLAAIRAQRTVEALLPETNPKLALGFDPRDVLR